MAESGDDGSGSDLEGFLNSETERGHSRHGSNNSSDDDTAEKRKHDEAEDYDGTELPDPETKKMKVSMGFSKTFGSAKSLTQVKRSPAPITIKLGAQKKDEAKPSLKKTSATVASVFNQDSDEEEMPPEARMRMRNIGRDTPTSAGPNSFGKTRQGFCDSKKVFERQLKRKMEEVSDK